MNRFVRIVLASLGLCSGCSKSPVLTPSGFEQAAGRMDVVGLR